MNSRPSTIDWQIASRSRGHTVTLDLRLTDDQRLQLQLDVHLTDRVPVRDLKAQCLRQALAHIQGTLQAVEQE